VESAPWYTWAFEGTGALLVSAAVGFVWRRARTRKAEGVPHKISVAVGGANYASPVAYGTNIVQNVNVGVPVPINPSSEYQGTPTPQEIQARLDSLPPFQQLKVKDSYVGLKVRWSLYFGSLYPHPSGANDYFVYLMTAKGKTAVDRMITCPIRISDFPRLQIASAGDEIVVTGTIEKIDLGINLKDVHLGFPEPTERTERPQQKILSATDALEGKLGEIRFDYLPGEAPENHGWELALDQGGPRPTCSLAADAPYGEKCLYVSGNGYRMDHALRPPESLCKRVEFLAKLTSTSVIYARVQMTSKDTNRDRDGWIAHKFGEVATASPLDTVEWTLAGPGEPTNQAGWSKLVWSLPEEVARTFGNQGWAYERLLSIRLRGTLSISPISLLDP